MKIFLCDCTITKEIASRLTRIITQKEGFTVQRMLINQNAVILYHLCKQYDHVIMLSKNQSEHHPLPPGSHLINLCAKAVNSSTME